MTRYLLKEGTLVENSAGPGTVTRKMLRARVIELGVIDCPVDASENLLQRQMQNT